MAATVEFSESNGAVESVTDGITNMNFGSFDAPNIVPASHPIIISLCSYGKWFRVHLAALGGSTQIDTLKFWKSSGVYVAGEVIGGNFFPGMFNYASTFITAYAHATVAGGGGVVAVPRTDCGQGVLGGNPYSTTPVPTAVTAAENIPIGPAIGGVLNAPGYSDYLYMGLLTTGATPAGPVNQKIFTLQWNET